MIFNTQRSLRPATLGLLVGLAVLFANPTRAQFGGPFAPPTTPMAQRNAMNLVLNQVNWFRNATRTASSQYNSGYGLLMQQMQAVRDQYAGFKSHADPATVEFRRQPTGRTGLGAGNHPGSFLGLPNLGGQRPVNLHRSGQHVPGAE